ncbi:Glycoside hydrolase family 5 domain-containing protein [Plasmodiophora brassicae]
MLGVMQRVAVAALVACCSCACAGDLFHVASGGVIVDQFGRQRIFHGLNVVEKVPPYIPRRDAFDSSRSLAAHDIDLLRQWGFNVVRLGVLWAAVEPSPGLYNETFLGEIRDLVDELGRAGIYTVIDSHQDLMNPSFCGEGFPDWATRPMQTSCDGVFAKIARRLFGACQTLPDLGVSVDPVTGYANRTDCLKTNFARYYLTPEVGSAFDNFFGSADLRLAFAKQWNQIARALSGSPYVVGYDLLNEPWIGNVWDNIRLIEPGYVDRTLLQGLHHDVHNAIREADDKTLVIYEETQFPDSFPIFGGLVHEVGFTENPAGPHSPYSNRTVLSMHNYCCIASPSACDRDGNPVASDAHLCDKYAQRKISTRVKDSRRLSSGLMLTEFGACMDPVLCPQEITRVTSHADDMQLSWIYWQYKYSDDVTTQSGDGEGLFNADGSIQMEKLRALSRTYAPAVQGRIHSMAFDATAAAFHLEFTLDPSVAADTEIYFNEDLHYPNGYRVVLAPPDAVSWSYVERNRIVVSVKRHTSLAQLDGTRITIGIQRIPSKPERVQTL